jgi:hypothetical protein
MHNLKKIFFCIWSLNISEIFLFIVWVVFNLIYFPMCITNILNISYCTVQTLPMQDSLIFFLRETHCVIIIRPNALARNAPFPLPCHSAGNWTQPKTSHMHCLDPLFSTSVYRVADQVLWNSKICIVIMFMKFG